MATAARAHVPTDSESVGTEIRPEPTDSESVPTDSESVPKDSESVGAQTPSRPKKIQKRRSTDEIQEQAVRSALASGRDSEFSFDVEEDRATARQRALISDLWIHATGHVPIQRKRAEWETLTVTGAQSLIGDLYAVCGRYDEYTGPEAGTPAYRALTTIGRQWADALLIPDNFDEVAA